MTDFEQMNEELIDLGQASIETKGAAIFLEDTDGSPRVFLPGIAED